MPEEYNFARDHFDIPEKWPVYKAGDHEVRAKRRGSRETYTPDRVAVAPGKPVTDPNLSAELDAIAVQTLEAPIEEEPEAVTDPELIAALDAQAVSDPALIAELDAIATGQAAPASEPFQRAAKSPDRLATHSKTLSAHPTMSPADIQAAEAVAGPKKPPSVMKPILEPVRAWLEANLPEMERERRIVIPKPLAFAMPGFEKMTVEELLAAGLAEERKGPRRQMEAQAISNLILSSLGPAAGKARTGMKAGETKFLPGLHGKVPDSLIFGKGPIMPIDGPTPPLPKNTPRPTSASKARMAEAFAKDNPPAGATSAAQKLESVQAIDPEELLKGDAKLRADLRASLRVKGLSEEKIAEMVPEPVAPVGTVSQQKEAVEEFVGTPGPQVADPVAATGKPGPEHLADADPVRQATEIHKKLIASLEEQNRLLQENQRLRQQPFPSQKASGFQPLPDPDFKQIVEEGGGEFRGIQEGIDDIPSSATIHDPVTGSDIQIPLDDLDAETVANRIADKRRQFSAAEPSKIEPAPPSKEVVGNFKEAPEIPVQQGVSSAPAGTGSRLDAPKVEAPPSPPVSTLAESPVLAGPPPKTPDIIMPPKRDPKLPKNLAGEKSTYGYGRKQFHLVWGSDLDRAAYIVSQSKRKSSRDAAYLKFIEEHTGLSETEARAAGKKIRDDIKRLAMGSDEEVLSIPKSRVFEKEIAYDPMLDIIYGEVEAGENGKRLFMDSRGQGGTMEVTGTPSTFPEYFQNKGYKKKDTLAAIDRARKGQALTAKQEMIVNDLLESAKGYYKEAPEIPAGRLGEAGQANEIGEAGELAELSDDATVPPEFEELSETAMETGPVSDKALAELESFLEKMGGSGTDAVDFYSGFPLPSVSLKKMVPRRLWELFEQGKTIEGGKDFDWRVLRNIRRGFVSDFAADLEKIIAPAQEWDQPTKRVVSEYLDDLLPLSRVPPDAQPTAQAIRDLYDQVGEASAKRGLIDKQSQEALKGKYSRHIYMKHLLGGHGATRGSPGRLGRQYAKQRISATREEQRARGLIEDPYIQAKYGIMQEVNDIGLYDFMEGLTKHPELVHPKSIVEIPAVKGGGVRKGSIGELAEEVELYHKMVKAMPDNAEVASHLARLEDSHRAALRAIGDPPRGFVWVPPDRGYGPIRGALVHKSVVQDLRHLVEIPKGEASELVEWVKTAGETALAGYKVAKTAGNIPSYAVNTVSNVLQHSMGGMNPAAQVEYAIKFLNEASRETRAFKAIRRAGAFGADYSTEEIHGMIEQLAKVRPGSSYAAVMSKLKEITKYYGKIDDVFKGGRVMWEIDKGRDMAKAVDEALFWGMDYSLVHPAVREVRKGGLPFVTYTIKSIPILERALSERPWVVAAIAALPWAVTKATGMYADLTEEDIEEIKNSIPSRFRESPTASMLPVKDEDGNWAWVDWGRYMPFGNLIEMATAAYDRDAGKLLGEAGATSNPFTSLLFSGLTGTDPFTKQPIVSEHDEPGEKLIKIGNFVWNQWMPSMLMDLPNMAATEEPGRGPLGHTVRALSGRRNRDDQAVSPGQAFGRWFGLNIDYPTEEQGSREKAFRAHKSEEALKRILRKDYSEEKKDRARERHREQLDDLREPKSRLDRLMGRGSGRRGSR